MKKLLMILTGCFIIINGFSQAQRKIALYTQVQYTHTLYDYTTGNNPWGMGLGLQTFFNNQKKLKPTLEATADAYLADDKVLYSNPDGTFPKEPNDVGTMINVFGGLSYHPAKIVYFSFTAGSSFIGKQTLLGIKPALGFFFPKNKK